MTEDLKQKLTKFTNDPDWVLMEQIIKAHYQPLESVMTIDVKRSNDEIASDVRGRQMTIESLTKFLNDTKILNSKINTNQTTFI